MKAKCLLAMAGLLAWTSMVATPARAQEARGMNVTQIERLFGAGVGAAQILQTAREACIDFRLDAAIEERLTRAGANTEFLTALRQVCYRGPVTPPVQPQPQPQPQPRTTTTPAQMPQYSPGSAMTRSLLVPGLGQFYTGRPALGAVFLAAWGAALGVGVMSQEVTVECLARVTGTCPADQIRGEVVKRPMLAIGVGGAVAIAAISAFEANSAAKRANRRAGPNDSNGIEPSLSTWSDGTVAFGLRVKLP